MPFDVYGKDELPAEVQTWLSRELKDLRFQKFVIPEHGYEKDFSLFCKIQVFITIDVSVIFTVIFLMILYLGGFHQTEAKGR